MTIDAPPGGGPDPAYAGLDPATARWLREQTGAVQAICRRLGGDLVQLGAVLAAVKERLPHGSWLAWADGLPWGRAQTYRLVQVAAAFGGRISHAGNFDPTALYALAGPTVPAAAREYAVELAGGGTRVTAGVAREILAGYKAAPDLPPAEARRLAPDRLAADRPAGGDPGFGKPARAEPTHPAWAALAAALRAGATVHLSGAVDDETGEPGFAGTLYPADDGARMTHAARDTPEELVLALLDLEPRAACLTCRREKPLTEFTRDATRPAGRTRYCKACDRGRVAAQKGRAVSPPPAAADVLPIFKAR